MKHDELKALSVKELKAKCKAMGLKGYSRLSEEALIQLILTNQPVDETDELDELLDGPEDESSDEAENQTDEQPEDLDGDADQIDESQGDEQPEDLDGDADQTDEELSDEDIDDLGPEQDPTVPVTFKKLIKGAFGFNGQTFKGSTFDLTADEASDIKIKNAIKHGLIKIK